MNVRLNYFSGQSYSQMFATFCIKVSGAYSKRIKVSFREKAGDSRSYASFSLPPDSARQLAYALLLATSSNDVNPVEFTVEESLSKAAAA